MPLRNTFNLLRGYITGSLIKYAADPLDPETFLQRIQQNTQDAQNRIDAYKYLEQYQPLLKEMSLEEISRLRGEQARKDIGLDPQFIHATVHDIEEPLVRAYQQYLRNFPVVRERPGSRAYLGALIDEHIPEISTSVPKKLYLVNPEIPAPQPVQRESLENMVLSHELVHAQQAGTLKDPSSILDLSDYPFKHGDPKYQKELQTMYNELAAARQLVPPKLPDARGDVLFYALHPIELTAYAAQLQRAYDHIKGTPMSRVPELVDFYSQMLSELADTIIPNEFTRLSKSPIDKKKQVLKLIGTSEQEIATRSLIPANLLNIIKSSQLLNSQVMMALSRNPDVRKLQNIRQARIAVPLMVETHRYLFGVYYERFNDYLFGNKERDSIRKNLETLCRCKLPEQPNEEDLMKVLYQLHPAGDSPELRNELAKYDPQTRMELLGVLIAKQAAARTMRNILTLGFVGSSRLVKNTPRSETLVG